MDLYLVHLITHFVSGRTGVTVLLVFPWMQALPGYHYPAVGTLLNIRCMENLFNMFGWQSSMM